MTGKEVNQIELMEFEVEVKKSGVLSLDITVPFHNDMPLNPMDISLAQQTPNQLLTVSASKERLEKYFPKSWFSNYTLGCNSTNNVSRAFKVSNPDIMFKIMLYYSVHKVSYCCR